LISFSGERKKCEWERKKPRFSLKTRRKRQVWRISFSGAQDTKTADFVRKSAVFLTIKGNPYETQRTVSHLTGRKEMKQEFVRFDMKRPPVPTRWFLRPLTWALSAPDVLMHHAIITKDRMDGLRPPYVLLCNHNAFLDFKVATLATFPHRSNYVVAIDGFIGREELLRQVGCICKRKFTNDTVLVRQLRQVIRNGDIAMIYPEARYSLCGTTAVLPASLGKLCKLLKVPVVTLICHGHHVNSPFWNLHSRSVKPT